MNKTFIYTYSLWLFDGSAEYKSEPVHWPGSSRVPLYDSEPLYWSDSM